MKTIFIAFITGVVAGTVTLSCYNSLYLIPKLMERQAIALEQINQKLNEVRVSITVKQAEIAKAQYESN